MLGRPRLFDPGCDLVLEAFPRSGNTYALRMLQFSQRKELVIRTHRHVPPLVLSALRIGKPVLLLEGQHLVGAREKLVAVACLAQCLGGDRPDL